MMGSAEIIRADALSLPLADQSVDLVITSPPYFALRSYQDGGEHYAGQLGSEATPAEFVDALIAATREMVRVLKPTGSIWVNLGDKYSGSGMGGGGGEKNDNRDAIIRPTSAMIQQQAGHVRPKSLIGIPWRYAIRCIDDLGLILRAEVIWSKPNGLPESVTDRVRRSHEQWFHFTREPHYYSAVDEIREPLVYPGDADRPRAGRREMGVKDWNTSGSPLGKLPGSVWTIPSEPLRVPDHLGIDHFAAFPMEWPRRIIQGWSPSGVCVECGEGRRPVTHTPLAADHVKPKTASPAAAARGISNPTSQLMLSGSHLMRFRAENPTVLLGYACACTPYIDQERTRPGRTYHDHSADDERGNKVAGSNGSNITVTETVRAYDFDGWTPPPTTPGVVLDPFGGTGTTALVAKALGRRGISVDMSADYCRLAQWRVNDPAQLAKAARQEKPLPDMPGQMMFEELCA